MQQYTIMNPQQQQQLQHQKRESSPQTSQEQHGNNSNAFISIAADASEKATLNGYNDQQEPRHYFYGREIVRNPNGMNDDVNDNDDDCKT